MSEMAMHPLGEVASLQAGVGFPIDLQGRSDGDYPLAKVGDISRVGRSGQSVLSSADHFIEQCDLKRLSAKPIPAGSVLFAKIGEAIRQNHRVIAGCPLLIDNNAMAAVPTSRIESRFLYHFLRTVDFYKLASATTVPALRKSELEKIQVPLSPHYRSSGGLRRCWTERRRCGPSAAPPSPNSTPSPNPSSSTSSATRHESKGVA